jgi:hypothetical protein
VTTILDGTAIDLDRVQVALDGTRWLWTCDVTESGQHLMQQVDGTRTLPLSEVYGQHGPLLSGAQPATAALYRQVLTGEEA